MLRRLTIAALALPVAVSCGKGASGSKDSDETVAEPGPYTPVEGDEATQHFAPAGAAQPTDEAAISNALTLGEDEEAAALAAAGAGLVDADTKPASVDPATLALLKASAPQKESVDMTAFPLPESASFNTVIDQQPASEPALWLTTLTPPEVPAPEAFDKSKDTVKMDATSWKNKSEIMIPNVGAISVKQQGQRGTCGAHTAIGYLEYYALKKYPSKLKTLDLSEQRWYLMAKKDKWATGGTTNVDGGSSISLGLQMSNGFWGETIKTDNIAYNIPLEVDCPYNAQPGANELQIPQKLSCRTGVLKVKKISTTYNWKVGSGPVKWYSDALRTAQNIFDQVVTNGLPAPVASDITESWFNSTGMITLASAKNSKVVGGHGYLIVGVRKLDESKFPGEGGMCFVIKNSWSSGWAQNGFACVTLAYWNKYRQDWFDHALDISADWQKITEAQKKKKPASKNTGNETKPETVKHPKPAENVFGLTDDEVEPTLDEAYADTPDDGTPVAETDPETTDDGYTAAHMVAPGGSLVQALYKVSADKVLVRGVLQDGTVTTDAELGYDATGALSLPIEGRGAVKVGKLEKHVITLCEGEFAETCHFNYVQASNSLKVGLSQAEWDRLDASAESSYQPLVSASGYAIEFAPVGDTRVDVRLVLDGQPTGGLRLKLDLASGAITHKGRAVGSVTKPALCTGDFRSVCRVVVGSADHSLNIFFKGK